MKTPNLASPSLIALVSPLGRREVIFDVRALLRATRIVPGISFRDLACEGLVIQRVAPFEDFSLVFSISMKRAAIRERWDRVRSVATETRQVLIFHDSQLDSHHGNGACS